MVSSGAMVGLGMAALVGFSLPVAAYLICRGRMTLRARNILVGVICFLVSVGLEALFGGYFTKINPQTAAWFKAHGVALGLFAGLCAGVFEESGRLVGLSFLVRKEDGAAVAYGIGHGGIEAVLLGGLQSLAYLLVAILLNSGGFGGHLPANVVARLEHATWFGPLYSALERGWALVFQIALSLLVWRSVREKQPLLFLAAIVAHAAIDASIAMIGLKLIHVETWMVQGFFSAIAVAVLAFLWPRLPARRSRSSAKPTTDAA